MKSWVFDNFWNMKLFLSLAIGGFFLLLISSYLIQKQIDKSVVHKATKLSIKFIEYIQSFVNYWVLCVSGVTLASSDLKHSLVQQFDFLSQWKPVLVIGGSSCYVRIQFHSTIFGTLLGRIDSAWHNCPHFGSGTYAL